MEAAKVSTWIVVLTAAATISLPQLSTAATCTYARHFNLTIPQSPEDTNGWMKDAVIEVPDRHIITDLDVKVTISHTGPSDLQIFLKSPSNTIICLSMFDCDQLFDGPGFSGTIFDDEAASFIKQAAPPFAGRYRPVKPFQLSAFDGENAFGPWHLRICDVRPGDRGLLEHFELTFNSPEPSASLLLVIGAALARLLGTCRLS